MKSSFGRSFSVVATVLLLSLTLLGTSFQMLMKHYLDEAFLPEYLAMAAGVQSEEYYINMAVAWFFAEALAKQWDAAVPYIIERKLVKWTHNKAIRKAIESYRIAPERKTYLKTLVVR